MTPIVWWQITLAVIKLLGLMLVGYGEFRLWTGTASPTARGLSALFAVTIAWEIIHRIFL